MLEPVQHSNDEASAYEGSERKVAPNREECLVCVMLHRWRRIGSRLVSLDVSSVTPA
jgi:hypothetical protein